MSKINKTAVRFLLRSPQNESKKAISEAELIDISIVSQEQRHLDTCRSGAKEADSRITCEPLRSKHYAT